VHRNKESIEVRKQNQLRYDLGYDHAEMRGTINTNIDKNVENKLLEATVCCLKFMHNRFQPYLNLGSNISSLSQRCSDLGYW
jgi:hypothetical protein